MKGVRVEGKKRKAFFDWNFQKTMQLGYAKLRAITLYRSL